MGGGNTRNM